MYDPRAHGADCDHCPLKDTTVVPPAINGMARAILVGEAPGKEEVEQGRPFVGASGLELNRALQACGVDRRTLHVTNVLLCQPPENNFAKLEKQTAKKIKKGAPDLKLATACCIPRLLKEIEDHPCVNVVTFGGTAFKAVSQSDSSVMSVRGGPREVVIDTTIKHVLPTVHPAFVMRARRWSRAFYSDVSRAFRWFSTGLGWQDPATAIAPRPDQLRRWIEKHRRDRFIVCDVETLPGFPDVGHFDPLFDRLTVIGLGSADGREAIVIPVRTKDGVPRYDATAFVEVREILRAFFVDPLIVKAGWNFGYYDRMVIAARLGVEPAPILDGIGLHKMVEPELPHRLGYVGSVYTDAPSWKEDHTATTYETDEQLWAYNAKDNAITAMSVNACIQAVKQRDQVTAAKFWPNVQNVCVGLHRAGMRVDQAKRRQYDHDLLVEAIRLRKEIREKIGRPKFNPNSTNQLQDLLFESWGLLPTFYTDAGDPSTNDDSLRTFLMQPTLDEERKATIKALRAYRVAVKLRGTYVTKLSPINEPITVPELAWDEDESPEERDDRVKKDGKKYGICLPDGRVHGDYSAHGTVGWRLSSSRPNCFDGATEVLTPTGWVRFDALTRGVPIAQWDAGAVTFVVPTGYVHRPATPDEVIEIRNQHIRLVVTVDHRCLVRRARSRRLAVVRADAYPPGAQQLHAGTYSGDGIDLSADELLVLCAMQADGAWDRGGMDFGFSRQRKIDRLLAALDRLEAPYSLSETVRDTPWKKSARRVRIRVGAGQLTDKIMALLGAEKSFHFKLLWRMTQDQLCAFVAECYEWDGSHTRRNCYSSSVRENAEVFQAAVALTGQRAHWREYAAKSGRTNYQIDVTPRDYSFTTNVERRARPDVREVFCVSVPSSFILVRREGEIQVTGQCQNFPDDLRDMIIPSEGNILVGCDEAQLELRMVAGLSGAAMYCAAFAEGGDPHLDLCKAFFGEVFERASKDGKKKLRRLIKEFTYAAAYRAGPGTIWEVLTSGEEYVCPVCGEPLQRKTSRCEKHSASYPEKRLVFPALTVRETTALHQTWLARNPEIEQWWERDLLEWKKQGFLAEPIFGLKRDFLDGEEINEIANYKAQSGGSALVHIATERVLSEIPFEKWGPGTGIIQQGHDALVVECPADQGEWVKNVLEEAMREDGHKYGLPLPFVGEGKVGPTWRDV